MHFRRVLTRLACSSRIGIKFVDKNKTGLKEQKVGLRAAYLFAQSAKLSDQLATIAAVVATLVRLVAPLSRLLLSADLCSSSGLALGGTSEHYATASRACRELSH